MQLVVITPENDAPNEQEMVNTLFDMGLRTLHLRKPGYDEATCSTYLAAIAPAYHQRIVIHGAYDLYSKMGLQGIHLRSAIRHDAATLEAIRDIPYPARSTSFHSWAEIVQNDMPYGSVFISPLHDSISKTGYAAAVAPEGITAMRKALADSNKHCPAITGLGGINEHNILPLRQQGYDGAALLGAIWNNERPIRAFERIQSMLGS